LYLGILGLETALGSGIEEKEAKKLEKRALTAAAPPPNHPPSPIGEEREREQRERRGNWEEERGSCNKNGIFRVHNIFIYYPNPTRLPPLNRTGS